MNNLLKPLKGSSRRQMSHAFLDKFKTKFIIDLLQGSARSLEGSSNICIYIYMVYGCASVAHVLRHLNDALTRAHSCCHAHCETPLLWQ